MSIRFAGAITSCLQYSCHRVGPLHTSVSTRPRLFSTNCILSTRSQHPRDRITSVPAVRSTFRRRRLQCRGPISPQSSGAGPATPLIDSLKVRSARRFATRRNVVRLPSKRCVPMKKILVEDLVSFGHYTQRNLVPPEYGISYQTQRQMEKNLHKAEILVRSSMKRRMLFIHKLNRSVPLLIGGLEHSAKASLIILSILAKVYGVPWRIQCEYLYFLSHMHWSTIHEDSISKALFYRRVKQLCDPKLWPKRRMRRICFVFLLKHNTPQECKSIIRSVIKRYNPLPMPLRLAMVDYYTKENQPQQAIDLLSPFSAEELKELGPQLYGRYRNLIQIDDVERTGHGTNFKILPQLVDLGLPLGDDMHNEVLMRAIELKLPDIAWEVYRYMEAHSVVVTARSHLVLLRNSFQREDLDGLNTIMSSIYRREDLYKDPYLVSYSMNIVRVVCTIQRNLPAEASLSHILAVYDRAYSRAPLVKLGIAGPLLETAPNASLPLPNGVQLGFALWTYVLVQRSDYTVSRFWEWFLHLVDQGDPEMFAAAQHDVLYNGLILYWSRKNDTLLNMVEVLEQMLRLGLCIPSELTWSLIICGFLRHNQEQAAEKVRQTMVSRNVHPDAKGWDFVLRSYSGTGLAGRVHAILDEKAMPKGYEPPSDVPLDRSLPAQGTEPLDWKGVELDRSRLWGGSESIGPVLDLREMQRENPAV